MSLSRHLTSQAAEHGRLAFHPDCPRCRGERLAGDLGGDTLISRRTRAALAAGVLAFTAAGLPVAAVAQEPDQQQEGATDPEAEAPELSPDFDPGGENSFDGETAPVPGDPEAGGEDDDSDGPPIESEPPAGVLPQIDTDAEPEPEAETPQPAPVPEPPPPAPVPELAPPAVAPAPAPPPAPTPEAPEPHTEAAHPKQKDASSKPRKRAREPEETRAVTPAPPPPPLATNPAPAAAQAETAPVSLETVSVSDATGPVDAPVNGAAYTVKPGDSLWSIARRQLGPQASTGQLARQVNRLWELNAERIGTGDPDMLHVGTVLRLP